MLLIGQRIDVEQLADGLAGSADILGQLRLERELLAAGQQVDKAADAGGQERQLIGDVRGVLVQAFEHEAVGKRPGGVEQAVGHGQADGEPALGILAVRVLLTAAAQVIVLARLHDAEADDAEAHQTDGAQDDRLLRAVIIGQRTGAQAQHGDERTGAVADRRRDGKLDVAQADIAERHGENVEQGDGQVCPDDVPGDGDVMEHDHIGRMQAHNEADGDDHFQMGRLILFAAAADLGKQIGAAPADERDECKPEPVQGMIPPDYLLYFRQRGQTGVCHVLQGQQDAELGMIPCQAALKIDGVGRADRTVGRELNGRALHERACRHDDLVLIAGHIRRDRVGIAVDRRGGLDALAEGDHTLA